jgi:hypothetical protein
MKVKGVSSRTYRVAHIFITNKKNPAATLYCYYLLLILTLIFSSCKKEDLTPPTIRFIAERDFTYMDQTEPIGAQLKTAIIAEAGGSAITNFVITLKTANGTETALDSGLYSNLLTYTKNFTFDASDYETWTYKVTDKNGKTSSVSFTLTKDTSSTYGAFDFYPSVTLGCQDNTTTGNFLTLPGTHIYMHDSANSVQQLVYLIAYYGSLLSPPLAFTFSSPGETDVPIFYPEINSWTTPKNEIRFKPDSLTISPAVFDASLNDSLIISNYTSATVGKRKFKNALPGYVIPFQITVGPMAEKRGLIKVIAVNGTTAGSIEFALKIQR